MGIKIDRGMIFIQYIAALILVLITTSCTGPDGGGVATQGVNHNYETMMRALDISNLRITVRINNVEIIPEQSISGTNDITIPLNSVNYNDMQVDVDVVFSYLTPGGNLIKIAITQQKLDWVEGESNIRLNTLEYEYIDNDGDQVYDFFEYSVNPTYQVVIIPLNNFPNNGFIQTMELITIDNAVASDLMTLSNYIHPQLGSSTEDLELFDPLALGELNWGWEIPTFLQLENERWYVHSINSNAARFCDDWESDFNWISSLRTSLNQNGLMITKKSSRKPVVVPIGGGAGIADMDLYLQLIPEKYTDEYDAALSNGPLNDSIKYVLVREGTWGWMEIWKNRNMDLEINNPKCVFNLTTPSIF